MANHECDWLHKHLYITAAALDWSAHHSMALSTLSMRTSYLPHRVARSRLVFRTSAQLVSKSTNVTSSHQVGEESVCPFGYEQDLTHGSAFCSRRLLRVLSEVWLQQLQQWPQQR